MKTTRLSQALLVAVIGSAALIGCKKQEEAAPVPPPAPVETAPTPAPIAATASVTGVTLGTDEAVTTPSTTFAPGDASIYAAVTTLTSDPGATVSGTLTAKWTHLDSNQLVHEESRDFNFAGAGTTTFNISKPDAWPPGKYRLEVSLDGSVVNTTEFEVK